MSNSFETPMDCSLPGSSVHGIFQARMLEWVAISFFRGSSQLKDQTWVSYIAGIFFTFDLPGKPKKLVTVLKISTNSFCIPEDCGPTVGELQISHS